MLVANDKGDNEMIPGVVHRSFGYTIARRPSDEGTVEPIIASNGVPFLQMRSVGLDSTSGREKEGEYRPADEVASHIKHFKRDVFIYGDI